MAGISHAGTDGTMADGRRGLLLRRCVLMPRGLFRRVEAMRPSEELLQRIVVWTGDRPSAAALAACTGLVLWHDDPGRLCRWGLAHGAGLEWVHSLWTGIERLPLRELRDRSIAITTGRGTAAGPLAEWVLLAVLWHFKRVAETRRDWESHRWEALPLPELVGAHVVVAGLGAIGREVVRVLVRHGLRVTGVRRRAASVPGCVEVVTSAHLREVCRSAAVLVVALPATEETQGLVSREVLAALPDNALVVNVGRGAVVTEEALAREVASGRLAAAIDAWWREPLPEGSPWWSMPGVLPSPHSAYRTAGFRDRHARRIVENAERFVRGRRLLARVTRRDLCAALTDAPT